MRPLSVLLFALLFALSFSVPLDAQPTISSITPNYGPGGSSGGSMEAIGTGFSTASKAVRFVDALNMDIFSSVSCASTTNCSVYPRQGLVPPGQIQTISVYALVNGVKSTLSVPFTYYGPPVITAVTPNNVPRTGGSYTLTGATFARNNSAYPGINGIYLYSNIFDGACASNTSCTRTANGLDLSASNGPYPIAVHTPGGSTEVFMAYYESDVSLLPPTPTITSVSPSSGSRDGGTSVTVTGTGFLTGAPTSTTGTFFTFNTSGGQNAPSSVNCSSTTTCTMTTPPGNGNADLRVYVVKPPSGPVTKISSSMTSSNTAADNFAYAGLDVRPGMASPLYTSEAGGAATFSIALNSQPSSNVTVTLTKTGFPAEGNLPTSTLTFTPANWNFAQNVTVTGADDGVVDGNRGWNVASVATSSDARYNNVSGNDQQFINLDNEAFGYFITPQTGLRTTEAGGTTSFSVVLLKAPVTNVTLNLTSNDPTEGSVSPGSLLFTTANWNSVRTVTITGVADGVSDGDVAYAILTTVTGDANYTAIPPPDVSVTNFEAGTALARGDFNADGKSDVVLRNYLTGQDAVWLMNGAALASVVDLPALPNLSYRFEGTADFNADGKTDIVLRNYTTGQNALWVMNGTTLSSIVDLPALANTAYHMEGSGDFNADGKPDIILRNYSTGQNALWLMNGTSVSSVVDLPALPNISYRIESAGDFSGDGKTDIVLRNYTTGQNALWIMNGTALGSIVDLPALPNVNYRFEGVGDFNLDGKPDIVLRNYATGQNALWLMNGTALGAIIDLPALANLNYEINGPR